MNTWSNASSPEYAARLRDVATMRLAPPDRPMSKEQRRAFRWCLAWTKRHGTELPGSEKLLKGKT